IELLLKFRLLRTSPFKRLEKRKSFIYGLQLYYYDKSLQTKKEELYRYQKELDEHNFAALLKQLTASSMAYLKSQLYRTIPGTETFSAKDYKKRFDTFVKRYPIIGSSTHSIINSIANHALLDYVIIDEASQQDI